MNRITLTAVVVTLCALVWGAQMLTRPRTRVAPANVSLNSSSTRFTSSQPDNVSTGFNADPTGCSNYTLAAESVRLNFRGEMKAYSEAALYNPIEMARYMENARRIIELARRCRAYTDAELGLSSIDLQILGLKPVRQKGGKP